MRLRPWLSLVLLTACSGSKSEPHPSSMGGSGEPAAAGSGAGSSAGSTAMAGRAASAGTAAPSAGTGASGRGAAGSRAGNGGAGTGGAAGGAEAGAAAAAGQGGTAGGGSELVWPNEQSKANSDAWLSMNHDKITQLRPRVLVIDLEATPATRAMPLIDQHIAALKEASSFHKYKDPNAKPALVYELVKVVQAPKGGGRIDYNSWNTQAFADSNLQLKDPANPSGPNLTLCGLFEKGVINEVWCMASSDPKCGETQEYKQVYDANGNKVQNRFATVSNGDSIASLGCKVSARITDFNSGRGAGCHQHALGHAWERYMDGNAVPQLGKQAKRFLNWDLNTRVGAPFSNFYSACNSNSMQLTNCIVWASNIRAQSGATASKMFDIADMSAGCGNAHFYANTTGTYSYDANMPDPEVLTSCENYGMHNGPDGKDLTTPYTNAMTDKLYGRSQRTCPADQPACDDDCGGHGTTYLYQNFPGPGTTAKNDDGTPMRNWWVYLFY
ncbi:MAG TPA: hypothetical protein VJR89_31620 [Polyangiales bacterium]|nr:hypothetical protein [Polyangiales bacterium]